VYSQIGEQHVVVDLLDLDRISARSFTAASLDDSEGG
jgi:hypothetical protein